MSISEERLSAFIEGDLDPEERAAVEAAIAEDPGLAQRVRALRARTARRRPSARLIATGRTERGRAAELIDLGAARAERNRRRRAPLVRKWSRRGLLAGVCLLGAFVIGELLFSAGPTALIGFADGALIARGPLAQALTSQLSATTPANTPLRVGPSFLSTDKAYCRSFAVSEGTGLAGVACREREGWRIRVTADGAVADSPTYQSQVAAMMSGKPLDAQGEVAAKAKGWRA